MDNTDIEDLRYLMQRLRNPETGCPWDLKQTFSSIVPYTLEEAEKCGGLFRPELDRIQKNMAANVESYDLK